MNVDDKIAGFPKDIAIRALEENLWALWSYFGRAPGSALHEEYGALWFDTPIHTMPYNGVLRFVVKENVDRLIDRICEHYRRHSVPFFWLVHPSTFPGDLSQRLKERGLKEEDDVFGMVANLTDLPEPSPLPAGFEIREVNDEVATNYLYELIAWRWHVPPEAQPHLRAVNEVMQVGMPSALVRCWLAWHEGTPVAKATLRIAAGAAGLYGVATKPEARGRGLARTLTLEVFRAARKAGQQLGVLHSTPMAKSLYTKIGFHVVAPFSIFASEAMHL
jgi:ribosomal protein S18 acetylase RimI-like enzyme